MEGWRGAHQFGPGSVSDSMKLRNFGEKSEWLEMKVPERHRWEPEDHNGTKVKE